MVTPRYRERNVMTVLSIACVHEKFCTFRRSYQERTEYYDALKDPEYREEHHDKERPPPQLHPGVRIFRFCELHTYDSCVDFSSRESVRYN